MRKHCFIPIFFLLTIACNHNFHFDEKYVVVIEQTPDSTLTKAGNQLVNYWEAITGKKLDIVHTCPANKTGIYLGINFAADSVKDTLSGLKEDAFVIDINENGILIAGKKSLSTLYAVNTFLEEQLRCIKFSKTAVLIPKTEYPQFHNFFKIYNPAFNFRRILSPSQTDQAFREWYKLNGLSKWGLFVHTFKRLIPPEKYFKTHPEYFSLINGRRMRDGQLCLSNPDVIRLLIDNLGEEIKKQPDKIYWSVSQNDAYNYCDCENCRKLYKKYGSVSGAYIAMANKIAQTYPDKQISTLAYEFTRSAPKNIKPLPNVNIMFCSIECNRSMPLADDPRSKDFVQDMKDWSALTSNIFMWDYVVQFQNYLCPFPNFYVLQPNIQFFRDNHVSMMFQQASNRQWSDLIELKQYLIAKLLWNPDVYADSLADLFIRNYYGDAAPFIRQYYETENREMQKHAKETFLNIYGYPSDYLDSFLSPKLILYYESLMDSAQQAVAGDSILTDRLKRARLAVDFAYVDIAINNQLKEMPSHIVISGRKEINPVLIRLLDEMEAYTATDSTIRVNERGLTMSDYKSYALNKLNAQMKTNKLVNARLKSLTPYSDRYPVGGEKSLDDGLFGSLDFHQNWLGYQGNDMVLNIDFLKETSVSEVQMNFLKSVNSWIFLPLKVIISVSEDGKHYREIQSLKGDTGDQSYLIKSVPFVFNFDNVNTRYMRITAKSLKTCPEWHRGFGQPAWIFVDEIIVN